MTAPMPKDNEVDEKVMPVAWIVTNGGESCEPWLEYEQSEVDALPAVCIAEPLYSAATVAELRAEVERLSVLLEEGGRRLIDENMRASAAERRVGELEADARRYRYLRDNANPDSDEGFAVTTEAMNGWGKWYTVHISGADLDSAIDTATGADPT